MEILKGVIFLIVFFVSFILRMPFVLSSVILGFILLIWNNFNDQKIIFLEFHFLSEMAIPLIFFSLGLGYSLEVFKNSIKKSLIPSLIDLLNFFVPLLISIIVTKNILFSLSLALALYPSSTAIIIKVLDFEKKLVSKITDIIIGILLFEDLFLIILLTIMPVSKYNYNIIQSIIMSIFLVGITKIIIKVFNEKITKLEKYIEEESGIFFAFGFFFLNYSLCKFLNLPEIFVLFSAGLILPQNISEKVKLKLEPIKNLLIGIFIINFLAENTFFLKNELILIFIMVPMSIILKIITLYFSIKINNIKTKFGDTLLMVPRGEFTAYIGKISNIESISLLSILISNLIIILFKVFYKDRKEVKNK